MKPRIAFFDYDGTLITKNTAAICTLPMILAGYFQFRQILRFIWISILHVLGLKNRQDFQIDGLTVFAGKTREEIRQLGEVMFTNHVRNFISEPMRKIVEEHRAKGDQLVILSAAVIDGLAPICRELNISDAYGTHLQESDGKLTGRVLGEVLDGEAKLAAARRVAQAAGVSLQDCIFYSDHQADLPVLEAVGTPVCVTPHRVLRRIALKRGWRIVEHDEDLA